jgi:hypothetical protein
MTLYLGIDEAGLGPTLGPLITASALWRVQTNNRDGENAAEADAPEALWHILSEAIRRPEDAKPRKAEAERIVVGDSKEVYSRGGFSALERTVRAFLQTAHTLNGGEYPPLETDIFPIEPPEWQRDIQWPVLDGDKKEEAPLTRLREAITRAGITDWRFYVRALHPQDFNRLLDSGLNKNELMLRETGAHIQRAASFLRDGERFSIIADKQGGRSKYAAALMDWLSPRVSWINTIRETASDSSYCFTLNPASAAHASFLAKGDSLAFGVALASMFAKYIRELCMASLNRWFAKRIPFLKSTAGYPEDANRFLQDIASLRSPEWEEILIRKK